MIFKNKVIVLAASLLLGSGLQMFAQDVNDNEITVKDKLNLSAYIVGTLLTPIRTLPKIFFWQDLPA